MFTRSSKHTINFANLIKRDKYSRFLDEYRRVASIIIDDIWNKGYKEFSISTDSLELPKYLDYNDFEVETSLSARALSSLTTQLSGVIRAVTEKRRKLIYVINKLSSERKRHKFLKKKLRKTIISKPDISKLNPELSSKCVDIREGYHFEYFVRLKSLGKEFGHINIPIRDTKVSKKWKAKGKLLGGISLSDNYLSLRFEMEEGTKNKGDMLGGDQGLKNILTLSNGKISGKIDSNGHSLELITKKLSRKRKGSKAFKRAQEHRKNFINWSINQLDFINIREIRLEKIVNIRYKKNSSRYMSHWCNTLIRDKIKRKAQEEKVSIVEQDCAYRSQRCFQCGNVRKANRKGKLYICKNCGYAADADQNAALNHTIALYPISWYFRNQRNNLGNGFFWKPEGLFTFDGVEFRVPLLNN